MFENRVTPLEPCPGLIKPTFLGFIPVQGFMSWA